MLIRCGLNLNLGPSGATFGVGDNPDVVLPDFEVVDLLSDVSKLFRHPNVTWNQSFKKCHF
jgi:hypothetical protein